MPDQDFEVRPSVQVGETADVGLRHGLAALRSEGVNPVVSMEFSPTRDGVLCGIREVKSLLQKVLPEGNREAWALDEGSHVRAGEVALRITAPYGSFGLYETAISGTLSHCTGWATASRECVAAAGGIPVISVGARHVHPSVAGIMDYSAITGGCVSCSTGVGARLTGTTPTGTVSADVVLIMGDTLRAMQAFDKHMPPEVMRVSPVNVVRDETEEAIGLARALRQRIRGVILDSSQSSHYDVNPAMVKELRARLDLAGHSHVEIFISGGLNVDCIKEFVEARAPVNAFEVGSYISSASPCEFNADIHEVDGRPVAKRGRIPGLTTNDHLMELLQRRPE